METDHIESSPTHAPLFMPNREDALHANRLDDYDILDNAPDNAFDDLARLAAHLCSAPLALICFFHGAEQWVKAGWASESLKGKLKALPRRAYLYNHRLHEHGGLLPLHSVAPAPPLISLKLRPLAAMPLYAPDGLALGSILVLDKKTRALPQTQGEALMLLAAQTMEVLELRRTLLSLSQANAQLGQQNMTDSLTGIPNRRAYDQRLATETSRAQRTGEALCLLLLDIDHFKSYNDEFGHPAGDTALQEVARLLFSTLRPYDFLARYGGEEFAIILPSTNLTDALLVAERLRGLVAKTTFPHRKLSISIGVSRMDQDSGARAMVLAADNGLYRAKAAGRNKVVVGKLRHGEVSGSARA